MRTYPAPPRWSVLLISAAALAYEILLMRLFSIVQWHHFAYMVISLALLGYGVSGAFLTLFRERLLLRFRAHFTANAALFALSAIGCFLLAQLLPFNSLEIFWSADQWGYLLLSYLLFFIPFFFAANAICLAFARFDRQIPRLYAFDLLGAGLGALGIVAALSLFTPMESLQGIALFGLLAATLSLFEIGGRCDWLSLKALLLAAVAIALLPADWLPLELSEYKSLSQTLQVRGARVVAQQSSPLGLLTLVESPEIPFRTAPGLSLNNRVEPPPQLGLFVDGEGPSPITRYTGDRETLRYLDYQTSALAYHLQPISKALILGLGGGSDLLQAEFHQIPDIAVVELDPLLAGLFQQRYADYAGWPLLSKKSRIHIGEARGFISSSADHYELIQISLLDSANAASGGVHGLNESYLYTREALREMLDHLTPNGLLSITRWVNLPPRDGLKLFATAIEALRLGGVQAPAEHLVLIRGWSTSTLLIGNSPFNNTEIERARAFCEERSFDLAFHPGILPNEVNRHNLLDQPYFYQGAVALLGEDPEAFIQRYKFAIQPASDDRPYFFNFFKWSTLPEILPLYRKGGFSLLELGYPILVLTLLQAVAASLLLILLPLALLRRRQPAQRHAHSGRVLIYFLAIGLGFLFIEIAFIQKFILFLAHPLYAVSAVLCGFLIFSGLGSLFAQRLERDIAQRWTLISIAILSLLALGSLWLLPQVFASLSQLAMSVKVAITLGLIAPLAFCMGMPFPLGLERLARNNPPLLPWAWGINGCASLISAILSTLLAIHFGFSWVVAGAVFCYFVAALASYGFGDPA